MFYCTPPSLELLPGVNLAKEILFSRTKLPFPGKIIQDLTVINKTMYEKTYHIYSMHDRLLNKLWYSLLLPLLTV